MVTRTMRVLELRQAILVPQTQVATVRRVYEEKLTFPRILLWAAILPGLPYAHFLFKVYLDGHGLIYVSGRYTARPQ